MDTPVAHYQRLTRNHMGAGTYSSLWLGPDHLLLVTTTGYTEEYRRFYFRNIQVLCLEPSRRQLWWGLGLGLPAGFAALMVLLGSESPLAAAITGGILGIPFFWSLALGPGCRTYLATAVQTTPLPPLSRLRKARAVVARLRPLILAAQADLAAPPPLTTDTPAATAAGEPPPAAPAPAAPPVSAATSAPATGAETVAPAPTEPPPAA